MAIEGAREAPRLRASADAELRKGAEFTKQRRWPEAEASFHRARSLQPNRPDCWDGLGVVFFETGRHDEAERLFRKATALDPSNAAFHDHLAITLRALKRLPEAIQEFELSLKLAPRRAPTLSNFGNTLTEAGEVDRAIEMLGRAVALNPRSPLFRINLARTLLKQGKGADALVHIDKARELDPSPEKDADRGHALMMLERYQEAIATYRQAAEAGLRDFQMFHNLGTALQYFGRLDEAAEAYRTALEIKPDFVASRRQLTGTRKYETFDEEAAASEELLKDASLSVLDRADLHMGLAKIYDDLERFPEAFVHLQAGNQQIRTTLDYSAEKNTNFIDALIDTFDAKFFEERSDFGLNSDTPVFILGMPRSGTTLVEQILCSHRRVHGAGELKRMYELFVGLRERLAKPIGVPHIARFADLRAANEVASEYLTYIRSFDKQARYITDKMPFNFRALGFISLLFPRARIIHCRRDPLDICLSCYFARFKEQLDFSFNLVEIGRYYRDYERIMEHWRDVVHNPMIEVEYEDLVADQEGQTRRLLDFCGLDWDNRCLEFHETDRPVLTASNWQVRQPIYKSSVGRWRNYSEFLPPLFSSLRMEQPQMRSASPGDDAAPARGRAPEPNRANVIAASA